MMDKTIYEEMYNNLSPIEKEATAYHEAGHTFFMVSCGLPYAKTTIIPSEIGIGNVSFMNIKKPIPIPLRNAVNSLVAGPLAEKKFYKEKGYDDLSEEAAEYIEDIFDGYAEYGDIVKCNMAKYDIVDCLYITDEKYIRSRMASLEIMLDNSNVWRDITKIAERLIEKKTINKKDLKELGVLCDLF